MIWQDFLDSQECFADAELKVRVADSKKYKGLI